MCDTRQWCSPMHFTGENWILCLADLANIAQKCSPLVRPYRTTQIISLTGKIFFFHCFTCNVKCMPPNPSCTSWNSQLDMYISGEWSCAMQKEWCDRRQLILKKSDLFAVITRFDQYSAEIFILTASYIGIYQCLSLYAEALPIIALGENNMKLCVAQM